MRVVPPAYEADDRSILLPYYKKYVVEPTLRFIPDRVNPNSITHLGHLLCLAAAALLLATSPSRGPLFAISGVLVQIYVYCDNADGAHARRTKQSSPLGEFLDHGLDLFNTAYIGFISVIVIGGEAKSWALMGFLIPSAAAGVYWEQAELGVFRVGLVSQLESSAVLAIALVVATFFGTEIFVRPILFGLCVRDGIIVWTISGICIGILRGMYRVGVHSISRLGPILSLVAFNGVLVASFFTHSLDALAVVVVGTLANSAFGLRMLSFRLGRQRPKTDLVFCVGALSLLLAMALHIEVRGAMIFVVICSVVFTLEGAIATRTSLRVVSRT